MADDYGTGGHFFHSPFSFLMVSFGGGCFRVFPFIRGMWEVDLVKNDHEL